RLDIPIHIRTTKCCICDCICNRINQFHFCHYNQSLLMEQKQEYSLGSYALVHETLNRMCVLLLQMIPFHPHFAETLPDVMTKALIVRMSFLYQARFLVLISSFFLLML